MDIKKLTIVNVVLGIAVVILFALHFMGGNTKTTHKNTVETQLPEVDSSEVATIVDVQKGMNIAWVNSDSMTMNYNFSIDLSNELEAKLKSSENKLLKLDKVLKEKYAKLEAEYKILGEQEIQQRTMELQQLQQELQMKQMELEEQLSNKSAQSTNEFVIETNTFMQEIGKELGYDYIFTFALGGQMMYGAPELDITDQMIVLLNERYALYKQN